MRADVDIDNALFLLRKKDREESPWDGKVLHVSDLALCTRQVWARRNDLMSDDDDVDNFLQMRFGLDYEKTMCAALDVAGIRYDYQVPIEGTILGYKLVGTADFVFDDAVLDTKTTVFWSGYVGRGDEKRKTTKIPEEPKMSYRIQTAAYAMALGKSRYGIHVACRATGKRANFWYDTAALAPMIGKRIVEIQETGVDDPEPVDARPPWYTYNEDGTSWQCKYCSYSACELNRNPSLQVI